MWKLCLAAYRSAGGGRLLVYDGDWCDVGSPAGLAEAEAMLGEGSG